MSSPSTHTPRRRRTLAVVPLLFLLAACTADGGMPFDPPPPEIEQVETLPADTRFVEMGPWADVATVPVVIRAAVVDGTRVDVAFRGGETPCFFVHHVETDESEAGVTVTVFAAGGPTEETPDCSGTPVSGQAVTVQLQQPLGDRPLRDGSRVVEG